MVSPVIRASSLFFAAFAVCCPSLLKAKPITKVIATGFDRPLWVGAPKHDTSHLWIMEQGGKIWKINADTGERADKPFLDISSRVRREKNEEGLLGLAFAPDFEKTGRFYINYTDLDLVSRVERLHATGPDYDYADDSKTELLLTYKQPYWNHNGCWLDFGPDGYLYISTGDGGSANDPHENGQNLDSLLGKLLRIDVSGATGYSCPPDNPFFGKDKLGRDEIWAYGLRNPWRCSFDRKTNDLWIGDVGQNAWEEINFLPANHPGGANFGWRAREGFHATPKVGGPSPEGAIDPVYEYKHGTAPNEGYSVTGGYVYRGSVKELEGRYIFADFQNCRLWSFVLKDGKAEDFQDHTEEMAPESDDKKLNRIGLVSSFGEDPAGELYITCLEGYVLKIISQ